MEHVCKHELQAQGRSKPRHLPQSFIFSFLFKCSHHKYPKYPKYPEYPKYPKNLGRKFNHGHYLSQKFLPQS